MPGAALLVKRWTARSLLALALLFAQHGALWHAYSHFGLTPDPYATGDGHAPPTHGCELGVVHAALEGSPPSSAMPCAVTLAAPTPATLSAAAFTPLPLRSFHSRAPPART